MSGVMTWSVTVTYGLFCGRCNAQWSSPVLSRLAGGFDADIRACAPAFALGWRVYCGERTQHTYCPDHQPTVPMRQIYPTPREDAR